MLHKRRWIILSTLLFLTELWQIRRICGELSFGTSLQLEVYDIGNKETDGCRWSGAISPNPMELDDRVILYEPAIWLSIALDQTRFNQAYLGAKLSYDTFTHRLLVNRTMNTTNAYINYMLDHLGPDGARNVTAERVDIDLSDQIAGIIYNNLKSQRSSSTYFVGSTLQLYHHQKVVNAILERAPLNVTFESHIYFVNDDGTEMTFANARLILIVLPIQHRLEFESTALNANRTLFPEKGVHTMKTPAAIHYCENGGQLSEDGFCDCRNGFSGPKCVFPCPYNVSGIFTPERCADTRFDKECILNLNWLFDKCDHGTVLFEKDAISLTTLANNTELQVVMNITNSIRFLPKIPLKFQIEGVGYFIDDVPAEDTRFVNYKLAKICPLNGTEVYKNCDHPQALKLTAFRNMFMTISLTDFLPSAKIATKSFSSLSELPFSPNLILLHAKDRPTFSITVMDSECTGMLSGLEIVCVTDCDVSSVEKIIEGYDCRRNSTIEHAAETGFFDYFNSRSYKARVKNTAGWSEYGPIFRYEAPFHWLPFVLGLVMFLTVGGIVAVLTMRHLHKWYRQYQSVSRALAEQQRQGRSNDQEALLTETSENDTNNRT